MRLRDWIVLAVVFGVSGQAPSALAQGDAVAVKDTIKSYYASYAALDTVKYRALLTKDYALLENGTLLDADGDVALLPAPDPAFRRTDAFDFRSVKVQGAVAYAVYFVKSEIRDREGQRQKEWLESMVLRRVGKHWRVALLHSTRIAAPK